MPVVAYTTLHRIGLPPFLGFMLDRSFLTTMLICWAITPGMMFVIGLLGEFRLLPISPQYQFVSFFPGDLFLGAAVAALLRAAQELPDKLQWFTMPAVHILIFAGACYVAFRLTKMELDQAIYPKMAVLSPTKIYHNWVLYAGYGYVASVTLLAVLVGSDWSNPAVRKWVVLALILVIPWVLAVAFEGMVFGAAGMARKARHAHVADWYYGWLVAYYAVKNLVTGR